MLARKPLKNKKCKVCKAEYQPGMAMQIVCGVSCALELNKLRAEKSVERMKKEDAKSLRELKEKVKPRSKWLSEAQSVVNRYVRLRDAHLGCVSCDKPADWHGQWHASHFRSVGAAPQLRFNLNNIQKSCSMCNNHLSGNIHRYRPELVRRIGLQKVEWLEAYQGSARYEIGYLRRIKAVFKKKSALLERKINEMSC